MSTATFTAHAYFCDTRTLDPGCSAVLERLLSPAERARRDRLWRFDDRRDYVAAHGFLRVVLAGQVRKAPGELVFATDRHGKPHLVEAGTPPSFSLSHSRGVVACVIAAQGPVGIDVEPVDRWMDAAALARRFFSAEEAALLERCPADQRASRFAELWTLKEALLKAIGTGLSIPLDAVSFHVEGRRASATTLPPVAALRRWAFLLSDVAGTHKLAVAIDASGGRGADVSVTGVGDRQLMEAALGLEAPGIV